MRLDDKTIQLLADEFVPYARDLAGVARKPGMYEVTGAALQARTNYELLSDLKVDDEDVVAIAVKIGAAIIPSDDTVADAMRTAIAADTDIAEYSRSEVARQLFEEKYLEPCGKSFKPVPYDLALYLENILHCKAFNYVDGAGGTCTTLGWVGGVYKELDDLQLKSFMRRLFEKFGWGRYIRKAQFNDAIDIVGMQLKRYNLFDFDLNEDIVNFKNGILNLKTLEFSNHDPAILNRVQLQAEWHEDQKPTPYWDSYLNTLMRGNQKLIQILEEYAGYVFSNVFGHRMKSILLIFGKADCGKGIYLAVLRALVGYQSCAGIELKQLSERFGMSGVVGSRLAGNADTSYVKLDDTSMLKQSTGGDDVPVEFKYEKPGTAPMRSCFVFVANDYPRFGSDHGDQTYGRFLPIYCDNVVPKDQRDDRLREKIIAEAEGIIHKCLLRFRAMYFEGNRQFCECDEVKQWRTQYEQVNDPAVEFFDKFFVKSDDKKKRIKSACAYAAYDNWYRAMYGRAYRKERGEFFDAICTHTKLSKDELLVKSGGYFVLNHYVPAIPYDRTTGPDGKPCDKDFEFAVLRESGVEVEEWLRLNAANDRTFKQIKDVTV